MPISWLFRGGICTRGSLEQVCSRPGAACSTSSAKAKFKPAGMQPSAAGTAEQGRNREPETYSSKLLKISSNLPFVALLARTKISSAFL